MPFNINTFISNGLTYGGQRPALFSVSTTVPAGIGIDTTTVKKFEYVCRASELPPAQIGIVEAPYFGRKIKLLGDRTFPDWTCTIMNDEDFAVRAMLELWSNAMNRLQSNVMDPAMIGGAYKTDQTISQYSKDGQVTRQYTMYGAFPYNVGSIAVDWEQTNTFESFPVNWAYDYWMPTVETSGLSAGGINTYGAAANTDGPLGPS